MILKINFQFTAKSFRCVKSNIFRVYHQTINQLQSVYLPFYDVNHPFISQHSNNNMYTENSNNRNKIKELRNLDTDIDLIKLSKLSVTFHNNCNTREHLQSLSKELMIHVYFYNEMNPHLGMLLNIKQTLFDHYKMVGPVKEAWYQILQKNHNLTESLLASINMETCKTNIEHKNNDTNITLGTLIALINTLEKKKFVSCCKFKHCVVDNLMQFNCKLLSKQELIILQVLAQYAYYDYELI